METRHIENVILLRLTRVPGTLVPGYPGILIFWYSVFFSEIIGPALECECECEYDDGRNEMIVTLEAPSSFTLNSQLNSQLNFTH